MATYPVGGEWIFSTVEVCQYAVTILFRDSKQNSLELDFNNTADLIEEFGWYDAKILSPTGHTLVHGLNDTSPVSSEFGVDKLAEQYKPIAMIMQSNTLGE